jgi:signal transduction histidine kinase
MLTEHDSMPKMSVEELNANFKSFAEYAVKVEQAYLTLRDTNDALRAVIEKQNIELAQAKKLALLGELAAGVAHEIKNPLGGIELSVSVMRKLLKESDAKPREMLENILINVHRMDAIVRNLLTYARGDKLRLSLVDVRLPVSHAVDAVLADRRNEGASVSVVCDERSYRVLGDLGQLRQVFVNLLQNSLDASPRGAPVTVFISEAETAKGALVIVSVSDRGRGMDQATRERIFNPFFTTKEQGTGLGLALTARIVEDHRGTIAVESEEGTGTTFTVTVPCAQDA